MTSVIVIFTYGYQEESENTVRLYKARRRT